jgi:hypothetical protein
MYSEIYNIYSFFLGQAPVEKATDPKSRNNPNPASLPTFERLDKLPAPDDMGANEAELQAIGERGQDWQTKFGKVSDMEIYCYRLALEWGRLWQRDGFDGTF